MKILLTVVLAVILVVVSAGIGGFMALLIASGVIEFDRDESILAWTEDPEKSRKVDDKT